MRQPQNLGVLVTVTHTGATVRTVTLVLTRYKFPGLKTDFKSFTFPPGLFQKHSFSPPLPLIFQRWFTVQNRKNKMERPGRFYSTSLRRWRKAELTVISFQEI